jgi:hypothetical protein
MLGMRLHNWVLMAEVDKVAHTAGVFPVYVPLFSLYI